MTWGLMVIGTAAIAAGSTLRVSATVPQAASIGSGEIAFGELSQSSDGVQASTLVRVAHTRGVVGTIIVAGSANYSNGWFMRSADGHTLPYQLYADPAMSEPVRPGTQVYSVPSALESGFKLYAKVAAREARAALGGLYVDTIDLTISY